MVLLHFLYLHITYSLITIVLPFYLVMLIGTGTCPIFYTLKTAVEILYIVITIQLQIGRRLSYSSDISLSLNIYIHFFFFIFLYWSVHCFPEVRLLGIMLCTIRLNIKVTYFLFTVKLKQATALSVSILLTGEKMPTYYHCLLLNNFIGFWIFNGRLLSV